MDRHYAANAKATPPSAPLAANLGYPTDGDPLAPLPATEPGEWWFHSVTEELRAVIVAAALTPAWNVLTQLRDALYALFGRLASVNVWTKANRNPYVALTSTAGSIAVDLSASCNFKHTLTENTVLATPSNAAAGQAGVIEITQHASAAKTLGYSTFWKFANSTVPAVGATLSGNQKFFYIVDDSGTSATCALMDQRS